MDSKFNEVYKKLIIESGLTNNGIENVDQISFNRARNTLLPAVEAIKMKIGNSFNLQDAIKLHDCMEISENGCLKLLDDHYIKRLTESVKEVYMSHGDLVKINLSNVYSALEDMTDEVKEYNEALDEINAPTAKVFRLAFEKHEAIMLKAEKITSSRRKKASGTINKKTL